MRTADNLSLHPLELVGDLADSDVDCRCRVLGSRAGAHDVPAPPAAKRHLASGSFTDWCRGPLHDTDLGVIGQGPVPAELRHLLLGALTQILGYTGVAADGNIHFGTSCSPSRRSTDGGSAGGSEDGAFPPTIERTMIDVDCTRLTWSLTPHSPAEELAAPRRRPSHRC
ncbi:MAG: hypothetical protein M1522_07765 [Actinobacteria bacterium]|jgi:hypothetical protein|nr:hypothetical protein [Actinomycetota bacterium]